MRHKRYDQKGLRVFLLILLPYTAGLNLIAFGECMYSSAKTFFAVFLVSATYMFALYFAFHRVARIIQKRFPSDHELFQRIGVMLPVFYTMNVLMVTGLYGVYDYLPLTGCEPLADNFFWVIAFCCFTTTIITFLNEAVANWEKWKRSIIDTDQLKNAYQKTKLLGLKGQINPHFLFNCFNSLSSLINDDQDKAERFLDEMTKVHRYMLRSDDEQLVPVEEELKFARSYLFLIAVRFGGAIQTRIDVDPLCETLYMPPLSMQAILENIIYSNAATKTSPLRLHITSRGDRLVVSNNIQPRLALNDNASDEGVANLITRYKLLHVSQVLINESEGERSLSLPLFTDKNFTA